MKISLLSPVHNEARFLPHMIQSVQRQSHQDWELVFVDDGSVDSSAEIILAAAAKEVRIRLVSRGQKLGKVGAFNAAYAASSGEVIALLAGDDLLPIESLADRVCALSDVTVGQPAVAFFKIRTFSDDPRFDGMVLPRGGGSSRSGGSITMNRVLADRVFPINEGLVAEDIWLAYAAGDMASTIIEREEIVLAYRIHPGNSHPRARSFAEMNDAMHKRHRAWRALLEAPDLDLRDHTRKELAAMWTAESFRHSGRTCNLMMVRGLRWVDKAAMAAMSSPLLFAVRTRFYKSFSGRRGM